MAEIKISNLSQHLNTDLASGDVLPIVDVSGPETKKVSVGELDKRYKEPLDEIRDQVNLNTAKLEYFTVGGGVGGVVNSAVSTDATPVQVGTFEIEVNKAAYVFAKVVGRRESGGGSAGDSNVYFLKAKVKNVAGTLSLSTTVAEEFEDRTAWDAQIVLIPTGVAIQATGAAGTTISWTSVTEVQSI